jgi:hypothetical protein
MKNFFHSFILSLFMSALVLGMASCGGDENDPEAEVKIPSGFVDLGLPSKTLWYSNSASIDYLSYPTYVNMLNDKKKQAANKYVEIPTRADWEELRNECQWQWVYPFTIKGVSTEKAYMVMGKNGNCIYLPAVGKHGQGSNKDVRDSKGHYWMLHDQYDTETAVEFGEDKNSFQFYSEASGWNLCFCWVFKQP